MENIINEHNISKKTRLSTSAIKTKFQEKVNVMKQSLEIEDLTPEQVSADLKSELADLLGTSADKLKKIKTSKLKFKINVNDMSIEETTLASTVEKIANNLKESSEKEKSKKLSEITLTISKEFKDQVKQQGFEEGQYMVRQEIVRQAAEQGFSEEILNTPCTHLTHSISSKTFMLIDNSSFLDGLTQAIHSSIRGKDVFEMGYFTGDYDKHIDNPQREEPSNAAPEINIPKSISDRELNSNFSSENIADKPIPKTPSPQNNQDKPQQNAQPTNLSQQTPNKPEKTADTLIESRIDNIIGNLLGKKPENNENQPGM